MRRIVASLLAALLLCGSLPQRAEGESTDLYINGQLVTTTEATGAPFLLHNRVMVPLRVISEMLQAGVEWIPNPRSVRITKEQRNIMVIIDKNYAVVDGVQVPLDAAAGIYQNRTYVPLRFVGEALGLAVSWDPVRRAAIVGESGLGAAREGYAVLLSLEALPVQGAQVTVRAALTDAISGKPVTVARGATLEMHHRSDGLWVRRAMTRTDLPGVFVAHVGLFTRVDHTFDLKATVTLSDKTVSAQREVTVRVGAGVDAQLLDLWAQGGYRPQFVAPATDLETGLRLPVSIRVEHPPGDVELRQPLEFRIHALDAHLKPISGLAEGDVKVTQWTLDGQRLEADAVEEAPGVYVVRVPVLYAGFGGTVTWEAQVAVKSKLLNRLRGSFMTR